MFLRYFLVLSLLVGLRTAEDNSQDPLDNAESPEYRVVKRYSDFEHREYDASQWISSSGTLDEEGIDNCIDNLLQYVDGSNSEGAYLPTTSPMVFIHPVGNENKKNIVISIFLPAKMKNPPMPLKSTNYIQRLPKTSVYVKSLAENEETDLGKETGTFARQLYALGLPFNQSFFGYNCYVPSTKYNNENEVWFLAA